MVPTISNLDERSHLFSRLTDVKAEGMFFLIGWVVSSLHKGYTVESSPKNDGRRY